MANQFTRFRTATVAIVLLLLASGCDWTAFGGGPARDGYNGGERWLGLEQVPQLEELWSAATPGGFSQPVVAKGLVYVGGDNLLVFKGGNGEACGGTPRTCDPLWTAPIGGRTSPTVAGDILYSVEDGTLAAYDARGVTACGGSPKVCNPLWTAATGGVLGSPAVVNGVLYVGSDRLYAFDAAGDIGCGGTPRTCVPLWRSTDSVGTTPAVANGRVYVNDDLTLSSFDAAGQEGCTIGTPRTCDPLWTFEKEPFCSGSCPLTGPPAVAGGRVYIVDNSCCSGGFSSSALLAFDAEGEAGCSGSPVTCAPIDSASLHTQTSFPKPGTAVADGRVYATDLGMTALDAADLTKVWGDAAGSAVSNPSVANGVVYAMTGQIVSSSAARLVPAAFDAAGEVGCGGTPRTCSPLWTGPPGPQMDLFTLAATGWQGPAVAGGRVYARTDRLRVYGVPET